MSYEYWKGSIEGKLSLLKTMAPSVEIKGAVQSLQDDFLAFVGELETPEEENTEDNQAPPEKTTDNNPPSDKPVRKAKKDTSCLYPKPPEFFKEQKTLKEALECLRAERNCSMRQLRRTANIAQGTWEKITKGGTNINSTVIIKLKKTWNIPDRFFGGKAPSTVPLGSAEGLMPPAESQKPLNEDGSDPSGDEDWIKCRKEENHKRLEAEKGR